MFALSPLVSHLIPDSRLPPLDARQSGAELAGIAKEEEKKNNLNSISGTVMGLGREFLKLSGSLHAFKGPLFAKPV